MKIEEFEYAFQLDGPYDEKKGLLFKKENVLLDPYARAVTGQRNWGERPEGGADFIYHARLWKTTLTGEISVRRSIRLMSCYLCDAGEGIYKRCSTVLHRGEGTYE